ncbi:MAG: DUF4332 domain-containing protein [Sutterella sp.]|nr:DUF4332 domain-containing protein [Sutterella sp.]
MAYKVNAIEGVGEEYAAKLNELGIKYAADLLKASRTPAQRKLLAEKTGIEPKLILKWANHTDLFRIHGIGPQYAEFFEIAGVDTVKELSHRVPENLLAKLEAVNAEKQLTKRVPALKELRRYVAEAKKLKPILEY